MPLSCLEGEDCISSISDGWLWRNYALFRAFWSPFRTPERFVLTKGTSVSFAIDTRVMTRVCSSFYESLYVNQ